MRAPFERWDLAAVAARLADALERHRGSAEAHARALHTTPHGPMQRVLVNRYEDALVPRRSVELAAAFPTWPDFIAAVRDEDPGALEVGLEVLSRAAPDETLAVAAPLLEAAPWNGLGAALGAALSRVDDPAAVALALAHLTVPYVSRAIAASVCARAAPLVQARLAASPAVASLGPCADRGETMVVQDVLAFLGAHRVAAAWPLVARLWEGHADRHVRLGAGHALMAYGDAPSLELLARGLDDPGEWRRFFAVRALLTRHGVRVVAALGGLDALRGPAARATSGELLDQAATHMRAHGLVSADPELLDLALAWVKDRAVKSAAQAVLDGFGADAVAAAKARLTTRGKAAPRPRRPTTKQVARVREAIERARANLERIVAELRAAGYVFDAPEPLAPAVDRARVVAAIEAALGGPLPVSLRLAFTIIGGCDLTGTFPGEARDLASDAFVLVDPAAALAQCEDEGGRDAPVSLALAPDVVGKAGFSGGQEVVLVPDGALDARVLGVDGEPFFLARLAQVFRAGGFPGLASAGGELGALIVRLAARCDPL